MACSDLWAADDAGRFAVRNAGMVTCRAFVDEKAKRSAEFNLYMGWIDGYISAANQFTKDTYDLVPWGNTIFLATLLESHCKKNPEQLFYVAVNKLAAALLKQRLRTQSELIGTSYRGKKTYIYKSILREVQGYLKKEKLYSSEPDGEFGPGTAKALEAYQKANGLAVTGLPDQITLYKIFTSLAKESGS